MIRSSIFRALLAFAVLAPAAASAQPAPASGCTNADGTPCPIDPNDLCAARVLDFQSRAQSLGAEMCAARNASRTKADEEKVAKEFGELIQSCGGGVLTSASPLTQNYLYAWLKGPSEGWGADTTVRGFKLSDDLRAYREIITSSYGTMDLAKQPAWYKNEAAFTEAVDALLSGARETLKSPESSWALSSAEGAITKYQTGAGLADDNPRVKFLKDLLARIKTPVAGALPADLLAGYAKNRALRTDGAAGFYTESCDKDAASDDSLERALELAWAAHLRANGPKNFEMFDATANGAKGSFHSWTRAEPAFGAEMTGAWMASYVKKTYFEGDAHVGDPSAAMTRSMADAVNATVRTRYGLAAPASTDKPGEALGLASSKFDSNDNLRVIFPGKCDLVSARGVRADGTTGDVLMKGSDWDPRGIYDKDSFRNDKDFPLTELVFREPTGADKDKARGYDVTMKCGGQEEKFRISVPPRPDVDGNVAFVTNDEKPPYEAMLADGEINSIFIGGQHTRELEVSVKAYKEMGFKEVSRKSGVKLQPRFLELLVEKGRDGKPKADYMIKDAHANGYAYDAGMFRVNKTGDEVVLEKKSADGKIHRVTMLGNAKGEGNVAADAYETVDYGKYFDAMAKRGDASFLVGNFSCWSMGKSAFEMDGTRNKNVKYVPTDKTASYYEAYWRGISDAEITFELVKGIDKRMDYNAMKAAWKTFDDEILMPNDPAFVPTIVDSIKSHRAGDSGIPTRVELNSVAAVTPHS